MRPADLPAVEIIPVPEAAIPLASTKNLDLWPVSIFERAQSALFYLSANPIWAEYTPSLRRKSVGGGFSTWP